MEHYTAAKYEEAIKQFVEELEKNKDNIQLCETRVGYIRDSLFKMADVIPTSEFMTWLTNQATNHNNSYAQAVLYLMYDGESEILKDEALALHWKNLSVVQGNLLALRRVALDHTTSIVDCIKIYESIADRGSAWAKNALGDLYEAGDYSGEYRDYEKAVTYYRMAADEGFVNAYRNLGYMYEQGWGVTKDFKQALKWYRLAADKGHRQGTHIIAHLYAHNINYWRQDKYLDGIRTDIKYLLEASATESIGAWELENVLKACDMTLDDCKAVVACIESFNEKSTTIKFNVSGLFATIIQGNSELSKDIFEKWKAFDALKNDNAKLAEENEAFKTHIMYMPDGTGYHDAKSHAEEVFGQLAKTA